MKGLPEFNNIAKHAGIDIAEFERRLDDMVCSDSSKFGSLMKYVFDAKGKRIRPLLVYLSAKMFGEITQRTHDAAVIVETLHNATLAHDDVVDEAEIRRNKPSLNMAEGNKTAVLTGDYLFAKALKLATDRKEYKILEMMIPVICDMSEGELQQLNETNFQADEEKYYNIIFKKTASLISACLKIGAVTANASIEQIDTIGSIGEKIGYIFQIKDDILDYTSHSTGKDSGNDIKENKITQPLICALKNMSDSNRQKLTELWKAERTMENIEEIRDLVVSHKGISDSEKIIRQMKDEVAKEISELENCKYKDLLMQLTNYIIAREN